VSMGSVQPIYRHREGEEGLGVAQRREVQLG
jgi:hypothetical protein